MGADLLPTELGSLSKGVIQASKVRLGPLEERESAGCSEQPQRAEAGRALLALLPHLLCLLDLPWGTQACRASAAPRDGVAVALPLQPAGALCGHQGEE